MSCTDACLVLLKGEWVKPVGVAIGSKYPESDWVGGNSEGMGGKSPLRLVNAPLEAPTGKLLVMCAGV